MKLPLGWDKLCSWCQSNKVSLLLLCVTLMGISFLAEKTSNASLNFYGNNSKLHFIIGIFGALLFSLCLNTCFFKLNQNNPSFIHSFFSYSRGVFTVFYVKMNWSTQKIRRFLCESEKYEQFNMFRDLFALTLFSVYGDTMTLCVCW